jgi:hypothetical protein
MKNSNRFETVYKNKVSGKELTLEQMQKKFNKAKTEYDIKILNEMYEPIIIEK